jgi:ribosomal protein L11 methyltransferase
MFRRAAGEGAPPGRDIAPAADTAPLTRYVVRALAGAEYAVLAGLLDAFPAGLEERGDGEFVVYAEPPDLPGIAAVTPEPVAPGWETAYHAHLGRMVAGRFAVRPPWVEGEPDDLVVDPGLAFGAGTHPTTRMCLELLPPGSGALADWGSGTGVLALAALRAGYAPVLGIDLDTSQLEINGVAALRLDLVHERAPYAPVVLANLTRPLLEAVVRVQERPELMIASGFLASETIAMWDMRERERRELEGWAAVVLE